MLRLRAIQASQVGKAKTLARTFANSPTARVLLATPVVMNRSEVSALTRYWEIRLAQRVKVHMPYVCGATGEYKDEFQHKTGTEAIITSRTPTAAARS